MGRACKMMHGGDESCVCSLSENLALRGLCTDGRKILK
jgi:hypothetical protein